MTPFTDDDLKRLKDFMSDLTNGNDMQFHGVDRLLARLEAAERIFKCDPEDSEAQRKAFEAWLASKGEK